MNSAVIIAMTIAGFILTFVLFPRRKEKHGFMYENYPLTRYAWGSGANPKKLITGYVWTPYFKLKTLFNIFRIILFLNTYFNSTSFYKLR